MKKRGAFAPSTLAGESVNSMTNHKNKYSTSETIGGKAAQLFIIHYSFFIKNYSSYRRVGSCGVINVRRNSFFWRYKCTPKFIIHYSLTKFYETL